MVLFVGMFTVLLTGSIEITFGIVCTETDECTVWLLITVAETLPIPYEKIMNNPVKISVNIIKLFLLCSHLSLS